MAELISGPLLSLVLIVLAGIALRYALRTGKDRDSSFEREFPEMKLRITSLSAALERAHQDQLVAEANFARASEDYETLKRSVDTRETEWRAQRAALAPQLALVEQLTDIQHSSEQEIARLQAAVEQSDLREHRSRARISELEQQLQSLEASKQHLQAEWDSVRQATGLDQTRLEEENADLRQKLCAEADLVRSLQTESSELTEAKEQLERECQALQTALDGAEQEATCLLRHSSEMSDQTVRLAEVAARNRELESLVLEGKQQAEQLQAELIVVRATLEENQRQSTLMKAENRFNGQLRRENSALNDALANRDKQIAELVAEETAVKSQLANLQSTAAEYETALRHSEEQLQAALNKQREWEDQAVAIQEAEVRLDQQRASFEDKLRIMQTEKDELARGLQREQQMATQQRELLECESAKLRKMQFELSHFELLRRDHQAVLEELADLKQQHDETSQQIKETESRLQAMQEQSLSADARFHRIDQELAVERKAAKEMRVRNDQLESDIDRIRSEKKALEQLLTVHSETLQKLRADSLSIETLLERQAAVQTSLREHADRLRSVAAELRTEHQQGGMADTADQMADVLTFNPSSRQGNAPFKTRVA